MTIKDLSQLYWLNREIESDQERLQKLEVEIKRDEKELEELEEKAQSPSGPNYSGMPKSATTGNRVENAVVRIMELRTMLEQKKALRTDCAMTIQAKQILCLTERNKLERYITTLPDSLLRMIFTFRFINGLTWAQVSEHIGARTTEDSVRKMCYRYLADHEKDDEK